MFAARNAAYKHHEQSWLNEDDMDPELEGNEDDLYTDEEDEDEDGSDDDAEEHAKRKHEAWKAKVTHFKKEVLPNYFPFSLCFILLFCSWFYLYYSCLVSMSFFIF